MTEYGPMSKRFSKINNSAPLLDSVSIHWCKEMNICCGGLSCLSVLSCSAIFLVILTLFIKVWSQLMSLAINDEFLEDFYKLRKISGKLMSC